MAAYISPLRGPFARALAPSSGGAGELLPSEGEGGPPRRQRDGPNRPQSRGPHGRLPGKRSCFDVAELSLFCVRRRPRRLPGGAGNMGRRNQMADKDDPLTKAEQDFADAFKTLYEKKRAEGWSDRAIREYALAELGLAAQSVQKERRRKIGPH